MLSVILLADWREGIDIDALALRRAVAWMVYPALATHRNAETRIPVTHGTRVDEPSPPGPNYGWS